MKLTIRTLVLALLLTLLLPVAPVSAIYNGVDAVGTPNVVNVIKGYADGTRWSGCSGALVAPRVVVTAAHCVTDDQTGLLAKDVWVSPAGAAYKVISEGGMSRKVLANTSTLAESRAIYEQYKAASIKVTSTYYSSSDIVEDNDVAFIVLEKALPVTSNITIASDEETETFITNKSTARIYGYGITVLDGDVSLTPKTTTMNFDVKSTTLKNSVYLKSPTSSACPGDSGGPVIVSTLTKLYLVGVITGGANATVGPECSTKFSGNYYTLVTLITKYANLAFASAVEASNKSDSALLQSDTDLKNAKESLAKAELAARAALENQSKSDSEAKLALVAKEKSDSDAQLAREAKVKSDSALLQSDTDLKNAKESLAKAELAARAALENQSKSDSEAKLALVAKEKSDSDAQLAREAKVKSDSDATTALKLSIEAELKAKLADEAKLAAENSASTLRNEVAALNTKLKSLQSSLTAASKKLTAICKVKPKPKGC